ncbi:MAG: GNAT family N-acetyltransferase [archaeon]
MKSIRIKKSDKNEIYELALEEDKLLKKFLSFSIYKVNFNKKLFDKLFESHFKKNHFFVGIKEKGKFVAILSGYIKKAPSGNVGYIDNMMVSQRYRSKGLSTILRDKFFKFLKKRNIKYCQLEVFYKNEGAIKIYKKWGFRIDGLQMTKKL